jgi:hypothetical protein
MALPFGPPLLPKAEAACPQWQGTQEIVKIHAPQMHCMSIWHNDQATLVQQRVGIIFSQNLCHHQARGDSLSQPNGINRGGFFAQLKGLLTKKYCTVFVDHFSQLCFVHLQIEDSAAETMLAKRAFEKFAADHGVPILHYHCDNGQFADNAWKQSCKAIRQRLTFCGLNVHFQNEIAEHTIQDLLERARKQLLHACASWPAAVHFALWPYALCNAALLHNSLPVLKDGKSMLDLFSSI